MKPTIYNSKEVQVFLQDFKNNSKVFILEEGAEKDEIFEIAEARGINLKNSKDLVGFKTIYCQADSANRNGAILPEKELMKALPTCIGKPVDIDHNRAYVVGGILDHRYIAKTKEVIIYGVFYKSNFAEEWEEATKLFSEGKLTVSFEIWSGKKNKLEDGTYELYNLEIAGLAILLKTKPAYPNARVLEIAKKKNIELKDMVFASTDYKSEDLLIAEEALTQASDNNADTSEANKEGNMEEVKKEEKPIEAKVESKIEEVKKEEPKPEEAKVEIPKEEIKPEEAKKEEVKAPDIKPEEAKKIMKVKCAECENENEMCEDEECTECSKCKNKIDKMGKVIKASEEPKKEEANIRIEKVDSTNIVNTDDQTKMTEKTEENREYIEIDKDGNVIGSSASKYISIKEYKKIQEALAVTASELEKANKEKQEIETTLKAKVEFYKANMPEIARRREELGDIVKDVDDIDILDDKKYSDKKMEKANKELENANVIGKVKNYNKYRELAKEIDDMAFGRK